MKRDYRHSKTGRPPAKVIASTHRPFLPSGAGMVWGHYAAGRQESPAQAAAERLAGAMGKAQEQSGAAEPAKAAVGKLRRALTRV